MHKRGGECGRRLPQRPAVFKALLAGALLFASPLPARADDGARSPLFLCGTGEDAQAGQLSLSGVPAESGTFTQLRFERRSGDAVVESFPPDGAGPVDAKTTFLFAHSDGPEGYLVTVRFKVGDEDYELYSLDPPPGDTDDTDTTGAAAGLGISRNGQAVETIACGEAPTLFVSDLKAATGCDTANPMGNAGCDDDPPVRNADLDPKTLGVVR